MSGSSGIGLSLDERIRQSLAPLGGPLHIDAFVALVMRERTRRAQIAAAEAQKRKPGAPAAKPAAPSGAAAPPPTAVAAVPPPSAPAIAADGAQPGIEESGSIPAQEQETPDVSDSARLKAEVAEFLKRDEVTDVDASEVSDFLDFMGGAGLVPEEPET